MDRRTRARIRWRRWLCEHTSWRTRQRIHGLVSPKAWRYRFAWQLNRTPGWCWSSLVGRIEFGGRRLRDCRIDSVCRQDLERRGSCYCGQLTIDTDVEVRSARRAAR